jgi:prepilin-type N-terminal cleavage/methylation domain-containing protein
MSRLSNPNNSRGFSLLEVVIALAVLVIGVSAMAALSATMLTRGRQSKYMSLGGTLASEKIEDLNRWTGTFGTGTSLVDQSDPQICVNAGDTQEGSILADTSNVISCGANTETVFYYDNVSIDVSNSTDCPNPTDGCFAETISASPNGTTSYYTTYHSPDGTIPGGATATPGLPAVSANAPTNLTFHRRWVIEANPVINGVAVAQVRRITVLVTLLDQSVKPGVTFQMSVVRP